MHVLLFDHEVEELRKIDHPIAYTIARRHDQAEADLAKYADQIETARNYDIVGDDLEIDDKPMIASAEFGCWVSAWIWVPNDDVEV